MEFKPPVFQVHIHDVIVLPRDNYMYVMYMKTSFKTERTFGTTYWNLVIALICT